MHHGREGGRALRDAHPQRTQRAKPPGKSGASFTAFEWPRLRYRENAKPGRLGRDPVAETLEKPCFIALL